MGTFSYNETLEGDVYIQRLATYIRRNEEALANGLLCFSKNRSTSSRIKPLRLTFTIHHLYYITERIESSPLGVEVGPLNIKLDNPNHEPTFISFMANNARSSKHFDSDTRSITSINSMKSIVSSASVYWRSFTMTKDPKMINKDIKYLYSSFTKIPCLILTPKTKINSIASYEEYPCDTSVPLRMFKNLQVLELVDYEPNEVFGWHILSEQLRILIVRNSKITSINELLFNLVIDDESGRSSFNSHKQSRKHDFHSSSVPIGDDTYSELTESIQISNNAFRYPRRERATTTSGAGSLPQESFFDLHSAYSSSTSNIQPLLHGTAPTSSASMPKDYQVLPESKWSYLKQLTVSETSITSIPSFIFKPLCNLVKLNLSNNLLEDIPEGLDQLVNIKYLNLSDNYITNLGKLPSNLRCLSTINLNNNKVADLSGLDLLHTIEKIDLRRNNLEDLQSLKPIVLQFIKNPQTFTNVYLASNKLPKNYRIDLFNLCNGVKYKNSMKIDDSRPGYFESALLLDAEHAQRHLGKFLGTHSETPTPANPTTPSVQPSSPSTPKVKNDPVNSLKKHSINDANALFEELSNKSNFPQHMPIPGEGSHSKSHRRAHTVETLMEPFSSLKVSTDENFATPHRLELSRTSTTSPTIAQFDSTGVGSILKGSASPLGANNNLTNKLDFSSASPNYSSKAALLSIHVNNSSSSVVGSPSNLKRSSTLNQLEIENSSSSTTAAPNVLTPIQVTARMST